MADIFLSYSSADKSTVKVIATLLESKGWTTWWDRQIPIGQQYDNVIEKELNNAGCVVVIWTQKSVSSEWVKTEAAEAAGRGVLVPVMLEPVSIPLAFRRTEAAMLTD
ncbi:MAG TPA: toll/interleukin-1 receptor domain-containing protein, partial [Flavisolibacter sp.]|nr:toll/interleukin-1 receptor domain-containing protein [Flavisolibacter sp.]